MRVLSARLRFVHSPPNPPAVEIEAGQRDKGKRCYSAVCLSGGLCYSPSCSRVVDVAATRRRIGGSVADLGVGFAAKAADRVVTMLFT